MPSNLLPEGNESFPRNDCNGNDAKSRLIAALLALWSETRREAVSVRTITGRAGLAVSSIDYHFGKVEHLYGAAQDHALNLAANWQQARIDQATALAAQPMPLSLRAAIVAGIVEDWAGGQRPLAMAAREAMTMVRAGGDRLAHRRWVHSWLSFWRQMATILGMADAAAVLAMFHDGVGTQHLLRWNRTLDLALLHEDTLALLTFCDRREMAPAPVRACYRRKVAETHGELIANPAVQSNPLDGAAAQVLQEQGIAALTFRNVAARAGETLGRTSWHFGTKSALLQRAFEQLYRDVAGEPLPAGSVSKEEMLTLVIAAMTEGTQPLLRAFDEIILHISRSPDHVSLRGAIRAYRDPAALWVLETLLAGEGVVPPSLGAVFSSVCRGLDHFSLAYDGPNAPSEPEITGAATPRAMAEQVLRRFLGGIFATGPLPTA